MKLFELRLEDQYNYKNYMWMTSEDFKEILADKIQYN